MNKAILATLGAFGAAFTFPLAANASPLAAGAPAIAQLSGEQSGIINVQNRGGRQVHRGQVYRGGRNVQRAGNYAYRGGPRVVARGGYGWYGGHRGYRYARPGYRYYGGYWFPPAAFAVGALLGGALASQPAPVYAAPGYGGLSQQHYAWCEQRYISYRASDNSFQPYEGPRQACVSPYS